MREPCTVRIKVIPRHAWLWEPLEGDATFVLRSMFGSKAVYLHGKIMFCFFAGEDPWRGMLVCTSREHHDSLIADFPELVLHPVLGKWLYLSESNDSFDGAAEKIVRLVQRRDPRVGVVPKPKKKRSRLQKNI